MATNAQNIANHQNAQSSTGPTTDEGKARSSQNAFKHGLASGALFIEGEDPALFFDLKRSLRKEHNPHGPTQDYLVEQMATALWLVRRAVGLQAAAFNGNPTGDAPKSLAIYMRYQSTNERAFHKALATLRDLQAEHAKLSEKAKKERIGFVLHCTDEELIAQMAEAFKIRHDGAELAPEIIEAMHELSRDLRKTPAAA